MARRVAWPRRRWTLSLVTRAIDCCARRRAHAARLRLARCARTRNRADAFAQALAGYAARDHDASAVDVDGRRAAAAGYSARRSARRPRDARHAAARIHARSRAALDRRRPRAQVSIDAP